MQDANSSHRARVFAVIVLYRQRPSASTTVATLTEAIRHNTCVDYAVLLYDNSPESEASPIVLPQGFRYQAAASNRGLTGAYEAALHAARAEGFDWLLTLDQDTMLPPDFFTAILPGLDAAAADPRIATIVPHLSDGGRLLSPAYVGPLRTTPLPVDFAGIPAQETRAFNSASLLRVCAIEEIGGFDPCFWLDHLDSWLHHELFLRGWRMYVLGSVHLEHHFSLLNYKERLTLARFQNFLAAESAYFDLYGSWIVGAAYTAQLGVRLLNQLRRREAPEILRATRMACLRRLTTGRKKRIRQWRIETGCAQDASNEGPARR